MAFLEIFNRLMKMKKEKYKKYSIMFACIK